jgi:uncharacterized cupin superfamily protein
MNTLTTAIHHPTIASAGVTRARSFFDLRRFAADTHAGVTVAATPGADAFAACRRELHPEAGPVRLGAIDLRAGEGCVPTTEADEFIIVVDGELRLRLADAAYTLREGESAVLRSGSAFTWQCTRDTTLVSMRCTADSASSGGLVPIDTNATLEPSGAPLAELLLSPTPQCRNHTDHRSDSGAFTCGTWDSTPYQRRAMVYAHWELMYLLEGSVTLEDETGARRNFTPHDLFLVERGAKCGWDSREPVKKVYAIYRPA